MNCSFKSGCNTLKAKKPMQYNNPQHLSLHKCQLPASPRLGEAVSGCGFSLPTHCLPPSLPTWCVLLTMHMGRGILVNVQDCVAVSVIAVPTVFCCFLWEKIPLFVSSVDCVGSLCPLEVHWLPFVLFPMGENSPLDIIWGMFKIFDP